MMLDGMVSHRVPLHALAIGHLTPNPTGSAYLFTLCAFQLFFGKLYTLFSIKWVFITSVAIFELGSAICGGAPTSAALIVGRAIAGVGAAGNFSGLVVVTTYTLPLEKRPACESPLLSRDDIRR
jgi:MFS family permease